MIWSQEYYAFWLWSTSRLAPSGILTLDDVLIRRTYPIRLNRLFVQLDESMSMFPTALGYFWMRALPATMARLEFTRAPWELTAWYMIKPSRQVHRANEQFEYFFSDCVSSRCSFEASFISFISLVLNERMVLSFNPGNFNFYYLKAACRVRVTYLKE